MIVAPELALLAVLLALAALGHGLTLLALRRGQARTWISAAAAQTLLLLTAAGLGLRVLSVGDPATWLPQRAGAALPAAAWLALLLFLLLGGRWRSPGLGLALPLLLLPLLLIEPLRDGPIARGLLVTAAGRPFYGAAGALALALATLALAALLGRWIEERLLGRPLLSRRVAPALLTGALLATTAQLMAVVSAWAERAATPPPWTVQQTWLLATWAVLLLATIAARRDRCALLLLTGLGAGLLLLGLTIVVGAGGRP